MHILSSSWLQRMVGKSASSPEARIANLFTILQDWLDAPGMREQLLATPIGADDHRALNAFLLALVRDTKADAPEKLAFQLYFILLGALNEESRNPGNAAMARAGEAATSLVVAARPARFNQRPRTVAVASVAMVALIAGALLMPVSTPPTPTPSAENPVALQVRNVTPPRPDRLAALYQLNEKMRTGQCSYPQALMLAADQRAIFLEGVVNIDALNTATTNLDEVSQLYQKVSCSYAPAAMLI